MDEYMKKLKTAIDYISTLDNAQTTLILACLLIEAAESDGVSFEEATKIIASGWLELMGEVNPCT